MPHPRSRSASVAGRSRVATFVHGLLAAGHRQALDELREVAEADPSALEIIRVEGPDPRGRLRILISLATAGAGEGIGCVGTAPAADIRARERFEIWVPGGFPFDYPHVQVPHTRFAGLPHVQWRRSLCLYVSPTTEWQPSDGMFGFLERLLLWINRAAAGALDPAGEPIHPPPSYATREGGAVVIRVDTPPVGSAAWVGFAVLRRMSESRADLVGWLDFAGARRILSESPAEALREFVGEDGDASRLALGLAVLLPEPTQYEYPTKANALIEMLARQGLTKESLIVRFAILALLNSRLAPGDDSGELAIPVYAIIGGPMRGVGGGERRQHLAAWRLSDLGGGIVGLLDNVFSDHEGLTSVGERAGEMLAHWLDIADLDWARVYEERPEVTARRDVGSPLEVLRGKRVLLLGCGAVGGHAAEHLTRAGAAGLVLVDRGRVSPGVLVRQPYDDADIHRPKAEALADRLRRIRPGVDVEVVVGDARKTVLAGDAQPDVDLIIDAAANPAVTALLERRRRDLPGKRPPIISLVLGHAATRGIATLAPSGYSGGGADLLRKAKIAALADRRLRAFADDFFPDPPRADHFQPEPGCSEATFVGSDTEVAALTATMLVRAAAVFQPSGDADTGTAILVDLGLDAPFVPLVRNLTWPADIVNPVEGGDLEVRISTTGLVEMRAECRLMARRRGPKVETGGILLGEIDDACGVVWVSMASGPPPDSRASARAFVCGVEGVAELVVRRDEGSRGAERFLGIWHSHPRGKAMPSIVDDEGMRELVFPVADAPRRALLLILGGAPGHWGAWLRDTGADRGAGPDIFARLCRRPRGIGEERKPQAALRYSEALRDAGRSETRRWPPSSPRGRLRPRWWRRWNGEA